MLRLPTQWTSELARTPETGMGYQVVTIVLKDGREFDHAVIVDGTITQIRNLEDIPFSADEIANIRLTHDKWNFND